MYWPRVTNRLKCYALVLVANSTSQQSLVGSEASDVGTWALQPIDGHWTMCVALSELSHELDWSLDVPLLGRTTECPYIRSAKVPLPQVAPTAPQEQSKKTR